MPTYEYVCKSCGHELEEFQSMSAKPLKKCPACGKNTLERKIGVGAGVLFKGGGFYETDYRSESYKKAAEAEKPGSTDKGTDSKKADASKPAESKPTTEAKPKKQAVSDKGHGKKDSA